MGSVQFPIAELCAADFIAQIVIEVLASREDILSFSGNVIIRYGFSIFIDNEPLFIRLKGIGTFFDQPCCSFFFFLRIISFVIVGRIISIFPAAILIDALRPCACGFIFADYRVAKGILDVNGDTTIIVYGHAFQPIRRLIFFLFGFILRPHSVDGFRFLPGLRVIGSFGYQTVFIGVAQLITKRIIGYLFFGVGTVICRTFCGSNGYGLLNLLSKAVVTVIILDHFFLPIRTVRRVDFPLGFISLIVIPEICFGNGFVCPTVYASLLGDAGIVNAIRCHSAYQLIFGICTRIGFFRDQRTCHCSIPRRIAAFRSLVGVGRRIQMLFSLIFCQICLGGFLGQDIPIFVVGISLFCRDCLFPFLAKRFIGF